MIDLSLVSIVCTVFNQEEYVKAALDSVVNQGYENFELIILDNGSQDGSVAVIKSWLEQHQSYRITFISLDSTIGYCKAFNIGLERCKGAYVIDLSGDDLICEGHLEKSIQLLQGRSGVGFSFSNLTLFDDAGKLYPYYSLEEMKKMKLSVEQGDLYTAVIAGNPISASTAVFDLEILKGIGGYDESLSYEDFDVLVRLTRSHKALFSDHIGIQKRIHTNSYSQRQYMPRYSKMLPSTVKVCQKIKALNQTGAEDEALIRRVSYELKHAFMSANFEAAADLLSLLQSLSPNSLLAKVMPHAIGYRIDVSFFYPTITSIRSWVSKYF
ncbi:glycosyltransferase [Belliella sp. DSM 111904]|uniref:Glycosyltransferase n=1 Tax=Belliella filtrata TaxID=2923435 RepID=A0ABS9UVW6_9BACT|nr:glycosyltransferase [Belliella filtrata]MCH7408305.1 glycosyltransferase [Belliella filtrata]